MYFTHVKFVYFKENGKYYSEGEHEIPYEDDGKPAPFYRCLEIVQAMLDAGKRPGLVDGFGFNTLVTVYTVYGPLMWLFIRGEDRGTRNLESE